MVLLVFLGVVLLQNQTIKREVQEKKSKHIHLIKNLTIMKKIILTLSLVAVMSSSFVSCSTDDSALENDTTNADLGLQIDNGDKDLPKPPIRP